MKANNYEIYVSKYFRCRGGRFLRLRFDRRCGRHQRGAYRVHIQPRVLPPQLVLVGPCRDASVGARLGGFSRCVRRARARRAAASGRAATAATRQRAPAAHHGARRWARTARALARDRERACARARARPRGLRCASHRARAPLAARAALYPPQPRTACLLPLAGAQWSSSTQPSSSPA